MPPVFGRHSLADGVHAKVQDAVSRAATELSRGLRISDYPVDIESEPSDGDILSFDASKKAWKLAEVAPSAAGLAEIPAKLNGAGGAYNAANKTLDYGFVDDFPGSAVGSEWTIGGVGTGDSVSVSDGTIDIVEDGGSSAGQVIIYRTIVPHVPVDCWIHTDYTTSFNGITVGLLFANDSDGTTFTENVMVSSSVSTGGGRELWSTGNGDASNFDSVAIGTACWLRLSFDGYTYHTYYSTNTLANEPSVDDTTAWVKLRTKQHSNMVYPNVVAFRAHKFNNSNSFTAHVSRFRMRYL